MKSIPNMPFTKSQHYIPQFYLRTFSKDKIHTYVYDKKLGNKGEIRFQSISEIAYQNNFYTYGTKTGGKENLEDFFGNIEGATNIVIDNITQRKSLTKQDKDILSLFIAFLYARVPASKDRSEEMYAKLAENFGRKIFHITPRDWLKKFYKKEKGMDLSDKEIDDLIDFATNKNRSRFEFSFPNEFWIKNMLDLGMKLAPIFASMDWILLIPDKEYAFITSDNPFCLIPPEKIHPFFGYGLVTPKARKIIPLRSNLCLIIGDVKDDPKDVFAPADKNMFRQINRNIMYFSDRFCFSPDKGKLEKLVIDVKPYKVKKSGKIKVV